MQEYLILMNTGYNIWLFARLKYGHTIIMIHSGKRNNHDLLLSHTALRYIITLLLFFVAFVISVNQLFSTESRLFFAFRRLAVLLKQQCSYPLKAKLLQSSSLKSLQSALKWYCNRLGHIKDWPGKQASNKLNHKYFNDP